MTSPCSLRPPWEGNGFKPVPPERKKEAASAAEDEIRGQTRYDRFWRRNPEGDLICD